MISTTHVKYGMILILGGSGDVSYYTASSSSCSDKTLQATFAFNTCFNGGDKYYYITYYAAGSLSTPGDEPYAGEISTDSSGTIVLINYKTLNSCFPDGSASYSLSCYNGKDKYMMRGMPMPLCECDNATSQ
jgi:hypothetical protein